MPPRLLARWLTAREAAEVLIFAEHETLDPVGWDQTATLLQVQTASPDRPLTAADVFKGTRPWPEP